MAESANQWQRILWCGITTNQVWSYQIMSCTLYIHLDRNIFQICNSNSNPVSLFIYTKDFCSMEAQTDHIPIRIRQPFILKITSSINASSTLCLLIYAYVSFFIYLLSEEYSHKMMLISIKCLHWLDNDNIFLLGRIFADTHYWQAKTVILWV